MKKVKTIALALALAVAANSLWARPKTEADLQRELDNYDKIAKDYKAYWKDAKDNYQLLEYGRYLEALYNFTLEHPFCLSAYADYIDGLLKVAQPQAKAMAKDAYSLASDILPHVPDTEEGKISKAKYYKTSSIYQLKLFNNEDAAKKDLELCEKYKAELAAEGYYALARSYAKGKKYALAIELYQKAFDLDKEFESFDYGEDFRAFTASCEAAKNYAALAGYYDKCLEGSFYFSNFGAAAMSAYERAKQYDKAILVSILDREYALTYADQGADQFIQILKKNFGKNKKNAPCVSFVEKFYNPSEALAQADLDSLPEKVRDFMPVRYMFKMKNSSDVAELKNEFENFFRPIGYFYIRLYEKAKAAGDKKAMAEIQARIEFYETMNEKKTRFVK